MPGRPHIRWSNARRRWAREHVRTVEDLDRLLYRPEVVFSSRSNRPGDRPRSDLYIDRAPGMAPTSLNSKVASFAFAMTKARIAACYNFWLVKFPMRGDLGDEARGVEYGFYRTQPWPDSWGPPKGSAYSEQRLNWIRSHIPNPGEIYERTLIHKASRYLAIARHAERVAQLSARRDPW
jgi:hypothetical protein